MSLHTKLKENSKAIRIVVIFLAAIGVAAVVCILLTFFMRKPAADTILYGHIYTATGDGTMVEAAAIKDGKFVYVGNRAGAEKYLGENTEVLDYQDGMIIPGVTDTHTHVTSSFQAASDQINLNDAFSVPEYVATIKEFVAAHPDNEMYVGMGWMYDLFENGVPTKDLLDGITDKPIYIFSSDVHSGWVNTAMLDLMKIDKNTPDPIGGKIVRDANGEAVGMLKETAMDVYAKPLLPVYSVEQYKGFILDAQAFYASLGYTAYVEIFIDTDESNTNIYKAYEELDKEGKLTLRVQGAWNVANDENATASVEKAIQFKNESAGGMFELTDLKFFIDGVAEAHSAYFSEPYADAPEEYGLDRWPGDESFNRLVDSIKLVNNGGMVAHFHAIGDAAVTKALDAIEAAKKDTNNSIRSVITHLEIVKESDFPRFKELGVVASADLAWGNRVCDEHYEMEAKLIGYERAEQAYPYKSLWDAGATVSFATDFPPGASSDPFSGFSTGISRSLLGIESTVRNVSQRLTRDEALKTLTINGAYQMAQDDIRGTIEVGKVADFVIIDTNLLTCIAAKSGITTVLKTYVDGRMIYTYSEEE